MSRGSHPSLIPLRAEYSGRPGRGGGRYHLHAVPNAESKVYRSRPTFERPLNQENLKSPRRIAQFHGERYHFGIRWGSGIVTAVLLSLDSVALICSLVVTHSIGVPGFAYTAGAVAGLALMNTYCPGLNRRLADDLRPVIEALVLSLIGTALITISWQTFEAMIRPTIAAAFLVP